MPHNNDQIGHKSIVTKAVIANNAQLFDNPPMVKTKVESLLSPNLRNEMKADRIGARLKLLRMALDLKPSEISDMLDIERTYWSRFEGGKRPVSEDVAALLVDKFGVTLDFIILGRWDGLPLKLAVKMRDVESKNN